MRLLSKSDCLKNHFTRSTTTSIAVAIISSLNRCNINERDSNKFNVNEGRNTNSTYQHANAYTLTATATNWTVYQHSVLNKYFQHQHLIVRPYCTVKTSRRKMVRVFAIFFFFRLYFHLIHFIFTSIGWTCLLWSHNSALRYFHKQVEIFHIFHCTIARQSFARWTSYWFFFHRTAPDLLLSDNCWIK